MALEAVAVAGATVDHMEKKLNSGYDGARRGSGGPASRTP